MVTEKLKKEIGMVAKPLPEEIKTLETVLSSGRQPGRQRFEFALYQAEKLKKYQLTNAAMGRAQLASL